MDAEHYIVVEGRRWRATDPEIPEKLKAELVSELMAARRDVKTDPETARPRVQDAKVALGERGDPWWEPTPDGQRVRLRAAILTVLRHRRPDATTCPSDAARIAGGTRWRALMDEARSVAAEMTDEGLLRVTQKGVDVDPLTSSGPIRLGRGPGF